MHGQLEIPWKMKGVNQIFTLLVISKNTISTLEVTALCNTSLDPELLNQYKSPGTLKVQYGDAKIHNVICSSTPSIHTLTQAGDIFHW